MNTPTSESRRRARANAHRRTQANGGIAPDADHGSITGYDYHGCRCPECVEAEAQRRQHYPSHQPATRAQKRRAWLAQRETIDGCLIATHLAPYQHGTPSASDYYGCQCAECSTAARARRAQRDSGRTPARE